MIRTPTGKQSGWLAVPVSNVMNIGAPVNESVNIAVYTCDEGDTR
jgi:hypothetical protein